MASSTKLSHRIFALSLAGLFLVTSVGLTIFAVYQQVTSKNNSNSSSTTPTATQKLDGTKLKNFTPVSSVKAVTITDTVPGAGKAVKAGDTVVIDYTGALANSGVIFDNSYDSGKQATFPLDQVIKGLAQGMVGMKIGGTRQVLIPSALGYGATGSGTSIPPNADLVFVVTLHSIN